VNGICATRTLKKKGAFARAVGPKQLFSGMIHFVQVAWPAGTVSLTDFSTARSYAALAVSPLVAYASAYGPNSAKVDPQEFIPTFNAPSNIYTDKDLQGWVDSIFAAYNWSDNDAAYILNPPSGMGIENTDAPVSQGVLGYHGYTPKGHVYALTNLLADNLTIDDRAQSYALATSHEIVEFLVDPRADLSEPETSDPCSGNCGVTFLNYFDDVGNWFGGQKPVSYSFFTAGCATPATVGQCPAPEGGCSYDPKTVVPAPTPIPPGPANCMQLIEGGIEEIVQGQVKQGISDIVKGVECLISSGSVPHLESRLSALKERIERL
jgi:hypothetical protein